MKSFQLVMIIAGVVLALLFFMLVKTVVNTVTKRGSSPARQQTQEEPRAIDRERPSSRR